jgi:hypothetical protein
VFYSIMPALLVMVRQAIIASFGLSSALAFWRMIGLDASHQAPHNGKPTIGSLLGSALGKVDGVECGCPFTEMFDTLFGYSLGAMLMAVLASELGALFNGSELGALFSDEHGKLLGVALGTLLLRDELGWLLGDYTLRNLDGK